MLIYYVLSQGLFFVPWVFTIVYNNNYCYLFVKNGDFKLNIVVFAD